MSGDPKFPNTNILDQAGGQKDLYARLEVIDSALLPLRINPDFYNEVIHINPYYTTSEISEQLKKSPVRKYFERFPDDVDVKFLPVVRGMIRELDELVEYINANWTDPNRFTKEDVALMEKKLWKLVYQDELPKYKKAGEMLKEAGINIE